MSAPHNHCMTCGADFGTADDDASGPDKCYADRGGEHAETEEYSDDWAVRCQKAEAALAVAESARDDVLATLADVIAMGKLADAEVRRELASVRANAASLRAFIETLLVEDDGNPPLKPWCQVCAMPHERDHARCPVVKILARPT